MAKLVNLSVNVSKIDKARLIQGQKGTYLNLTVEIKDEADQYGNDASCWESQSEEERKSKDNRNYLGNGRVVWSSDVNNTVVNGSTDPFDEVKKKATSGEGLEEVNDLPF